MTHVAIDKDVLLPPERRVSAGRRPGKHPPATADWTRQLTFNQRLILRALRETNARVNAMIVDRLPALDY
jgi:hypothetical protein